MAEEPMAGENDDVVYLVTGNDDLITVGLSLELDDDGHAAYALFDNDVRSMPVLIDLDLDGDDAGVVAMAIWMGVASNTHNIGDTPSSSGVASSKRKSKC